MRKVTKGESVKPNLTASTWNSFVRAAESNDIGGDKQNSIRSGGLEQAILTAKINSDTAKPPCTVLGIVGPTVQPAANPGEFHNRRILDTESVAEDHRGKFVLAHQAVGTTFNSLAAIGGVVNCKLKVSERSAWIPYADVDPNDESQLITDPAGSAFVIWKSGTDGVVDAIMRFGMPQTRTYIGMSRAAIQPNSSGSVELFETPQIGSTYSITAHLDWMHGNEPVSQDKQVSVTWFPTENKWRIMGAECEETGGAPIERGYEGPDA